MLKIVPETPSIVEKSGVKFVSGLFINREHTIVVIVGAEKSENVDRFLVEARLVHWNAVRILPSLTLEEGVREIQAATPVF
ncbi:hypothetical protein [Saccharomonospora cyanea]|uniref:Uncharacterized protein n=1 Tax=Saccharomonospora cyanea NA-134 TaxID=882082 RepID=H5XN29_9PSEU|nr:hypothetical protein [Saccharomonospora cyanea]EHR63196.1 hypothetical protein SaccyDRAFT_4385 [Saccharomonospora cyanea NA-134]